MKKFLLLLFALVLAGCGTEVQEGNSGSLKISDEVAYGKADYQKIVEPSNALGWKLLPVIEPSGEGNRFISSASLFMAVSMVYNGADGVTKEEMAKVLGVPGMEAGELNRANASLINQLYEETEVIQLNIANSIWLKEEAEFQEEFAKNNRDYFNAEIEKIDVKDSGSSKRINDWVKNSTAGNIEDIVEDPLDPNLVTLLLNAIYFKGDWQYPFNESNTAETDFQLMDGSTKKVPLMKLQHSLLYMETDDFQAVSLPYGEGEMSMKVFLPKEEVTLADFEKTLTSENWEKWNSAFEESFGTVQLPKFGLDYEVALNEPLKKLGMVAAFGPEAEFPRMIQGGGSLEIDEVKQKTYLNVHEKGAEAAAVTSIAVESSGSAEEPFELHVDRPFFITIENTETGLILFMGAISEPMNSE